MTTTITEKQSGCFDVSAGGAIAGYITDMRPMACKAPFHAVSAKPGRPVIGLFETLEAAATAILEDHQERSP